MTVGYSWKIGVKYPSAQKGQTWQGNPPAAGFDSMFPLK